ncbi:MAG: A/G-specific adenine glycosylase [Chitinophagaceae bacterium]
MHPHIFTKKLMQWHFTKNKRQMPWKEEKDPYKIWLSEVILQQTRVEQGKSYYEKLIKKYPTILHLANAENEEVFKLWEGLGYYNRCKNLLFTARFIAEKKDGKFPENYEDILALKGIGNYTAAAISSFAFNLPFAVLDGNVFRVLSRFFGIGLPIDSLEGKIKFTGLAATLLDKKNSASYNQAIMDFGATICKPLLPLCFECHLQNFCVAYKKGLVDKLPLKEKVLLRKNRWFTYFIFQVNNKILVNKRIDKDIWQNLYEFYLFETKEKTDWNFTKIKTWLLHQHNIKKMEVKNISPILSQQLTHQNIKAQFVLVKLFSTPISLQNFQWINEKNISRLAFPKIINQYIQTKIFS